NSWRRETGFWSSASLREKSMLRISRTRTSGSSTLPFEMAKWRTSRNISTRKHWRGPPIWPRTPDLGECIIANTLTEPGSVPICRPVFTNAFLHVTVKRPNRAVEKLHQVAATRTERRHPLKLDYCRVVDISVPAERRD